MTAVIFVVSTGYGGYGDFLFALKLISSLQQKYQDNGIIMPVYLVTQEEGRQTIKRLKGDTEFNTEIITPDELKLKIDQKELTLNAVLEGPVFDSTLMDQVNVALVHLGKKIPYFMLPEYGYHTQKLRHEIEHCQEYRKKLASILYVDTIYSGFNKDCHETGIIPSVELMNPKIDDDLCSKVDENIRDILLESREKRALSMQYSHYSALPFMRIHAEFIKKNDMHQDVLMVGKSKKNKMEALISIKDALITDDFNRITFLNIEEKENKEVVIHDDGVDNGKSYRVIYVSGMSHQSMIACTALSGVLYGATGDQSLGEGISANKLLVYECLPHKQALMNDYYQAMRKILSSEQDACAVLDFLQDLNEHSNMNTLGDKLRNKAIQAKIQGANQMLLVQSDLISAVFSKINQWESELCQYVAALLSAGEQQLAIDILCKFSEYIPSTGAYNDKPFLNYATENAPKGPFVQWYHQEQIACYLRNKNEQGALDYLLQHDIKHPAGLFLEQAKDYCSSGVFLAYIQQEYLKNLKKLVGLIDAGKTDDALILALKDHISIAAPWEDKTIWQYTIEDKSRIRFCLNVLKYYNLSNQWHYLKTQ